MNNQQQMMMKTQFFNSNQNNMGIINSMNSTQNASGATQISKTIAQAKLRKQRANRGASNPMQYEHNQIALTGSNPTQDYQNQFNSTGFTAHSRKKSITNNPIAVNNQN